MCTVRKVRGSRYRYMFRSNTLVMTTSARAGKGNRSAVSGKSSRNMSSEAGASSRRSPNGRIVTWYHPGANSGTSRTST